MRYIENQNQEREEKLKEIEEMHKKNLQEQS